MTDAAVIVDGKRFTGWKSVRAQRSLEHLSGEFEFTAASPIIAPEAFSSLRAWAPCRIEIGGEPVLGEAFIDEDGIRHGVESRELRIAGRDRTADLVDCSAPQKPGVWRGQKLAHIAADLCRPFGITVRDQASPLSDRAFGEFELEEGETAFEAVRRLAAMRAVLLLSNPAGELVIARPGAEEIPTPIVFGENLLSGSVQRSVRGRYSEITCLGQKPADDDDWGEAAARAKGRATDAGVPRHRPLVILSGEAGDAVAMERMAAWEVRRRRGRGALYTAAVAGWTHADGIWDVNRIVHVDDPVCQIEGPMLVTQVVWEKDAGDGTRTTLTLEPPDALDLVARPEKQAEKGWWT
ncbi:MAG: hypothetical protein KIT79_02220 [Deltaproteobacteria bacterium]|nr:hypothetical protein [Deltaproteobacteria bacterium]